VAVGKLIIRSGMTVDGVIDQVDRWFIPEGEHEDESYDQLFAADSFVLGAGDVPRVGACLADHHRRQRVRRPG
jgi:hypothetical protein